MGSDRTKKKVLLAAFFIACMISFEFAECMLVRQADQLRGILRQIRSNNILFYLVMLFLFFLVFLGMRAVSVYIGWEAYPERKYVLEKKKQAVIVAVLVAGVLGVLADWFFNVQAHEFPYNALSTWLICVIPKNAAAALILTGMAAVLFMLIKKADLPNGCLYAAYVFTLIINFFCMYFVNIFKTDLYHGIAVLESIYNVCDLVPYSEVTTGIYGHYALFFLLPMRLSGGSQYMAAGLLALAGCIASAAAMYVIHVYVPTNWLRVVFACACGFEMSVFRRSAYYQLNPVRLVFPLMMCAYACFLARKKGRIWNTKWVWLGYLCAGLAVLWNTESGIFCLIAFGIYIVIEQLQVHQWYEKYMFCLYIKIALWSIGSMIFSIGTVNVYNLFCGGNLIFRAFFFPMMVNDYMNGVLKYDMVWGNHVWIYVLILFFAVAAWSMYHTRLFKSAGSEMNTDAPAAAVVAVLGLMSFSYYANRAAYANLVICYLLALCANALVIRETWHALNCWSREIRIEELGRKAVGIISIVIVSFLGIQQPLGLYMIAGHSFEMYTTKGIQADLNAMKEEIPENVYGAGTGISVLYHMLGWDNYAHVRDFSDLEVGGMAAEDAVVSEILQQDAFLISRQYKDEILKKVLFQNSSYQLADSYTVQGNEYYYYEKSGHPFLNWMIPYMTFAQEDAKLIDSTLCIYPNGFVMGPDLRLEKGKYMLHLTVDGKAYMRICFKDGAGTVLSQRLEAGEHQIPFCLLYNVDSLEFEITNADQSVINVTELYVQPYTAKGAAAAAGG